MANVRMPKVQLSKIQLQAETVSAQASQLPTVCVLCSQNCGLTVDVKDNCITKIQADKSNPITKGYSCNKAYSIGHYVNHQQRVEQPLKRQADGSYKAVSWDQAISEIAVRFNKIRQKQGAKAIALNGVGGQANHMDALFATGFMNALGSPWFYNSYAQEKTQHHWVDTLMMNAPVADMYHPDAWNSQTIFMMGTNPLVSNRNERATESLKQFLRNKENHLIVVDPRVSETARRAHTHLQLTPAGDAFLLMAMIKIILDEKLFDSKSLKRQTKNLSQLEAMFTGLDVTTLARQSGLDELEIRDVARGFANASSACVFYDLGIEQIQHSTLVSWLIRVLVLVTGNFAKPGAKSGGNHFVSSFSPDGSALQPKQFPRTPVSGVEGIPALAPYPMYSPYLLPEEIEAGNIHGLIVEGSNPLLSYGDTTRFKKALESLDILVVIEPAMTETARVADYVLPTPVGYEKWEWSSFPKGYPGISVQLRPPVVTGPKNALPEAEIYYRLAMAMGVIAKPPFVLKQLGKISKGNRAAYAQVLLGLATVNGRGDQNKTMANMVFWSYATLGPSLKSPVLSSVWFSSLLFSLTRRKDMLRAFDRPRRWISPFTLANDTFEKIINHPEGVDVAMLDENNGFDHAVRTKDKKIDLVPIKIHELFRDTLLVGGLTKEHVGVPDADKDYPLILCAGERTPWNANTIHRSPKWRKGRGPHFWIKIHPDTAKQYQFNDNELVKLITVNGQIQAPVKITDSVMKGVLTVPNGFGAEYPDEDTGVLRTAGQNVNLVTSLDRRDPVTGIPFLKHQHCRLEKVDVSSVKVETETDLEGVTI